MANGGSLFESHILYVCLARFLLDSSSGTSLLTAGKSDESELLLA